MNRLNKKDIENLLPHREPMLLIDKLINFFGSSKPLFSCLDAITHIKENRDLAAINRKVLRKGNIL